MKKKYTLKELADIGVLESAKHSNHQKAREAFTKAILDTIGFELPKDEEREAFDAWWGNIDHYPGDDDEVFAVWKAGREELRRRECLDKQPTEPAWIPWGGRRVPAAGYGEEVGSCVLQSDRGVMCKHFRKQLATRKIRHKNLWNP